MAVSEENKLHGAAIAQLLVSLGNEVSDKSYNLKSYTSRSGYILEVQKSISDLGLVQRISNSSSVSRVGIFIKMSSKRRSPWQYSFTRQHQSEVLELYKECGEVFVLFANHDDGVACLNYDQLKEVLDEEFEDVESVTISRKLREAYRVSGRDGKLQQALPKNNFPKALVDFIAKL